MADQQLYSLKVKIDDKKNTVELKVGGFLSPEERQIFADMLHATVKYDSLYLIRALKDIASDEPLDFDLLDLVKPTFH